MKILARVIQPFNGFMRVTAVLIINMNLTKIEAKNDEEY